MRKLIQRVTRRSFLTAGSVGTMVAVAMPYEVGAVQPTPEEEGNIAVVNAFCAAFVVPFDWERVAASLRSDCKYRASQNIPMVEGPDAIVGLLQSFAGNATSAEFEITDTWARGPVVVNDRMDRFVLPNRTLEIPVVGVFYLVDGQIAEWTDFVFDFSV